MAKAKKPASGSKSTSQTSKTAAEKGTGNAEKPSETSSASKAAAAKSEKAVSKSTDAAQKSTPTPKPSAAASKSTASKATGSSASEASAAPKTSVSEKTDATKKPDAANKSSATAAKADDKTSSSQPATPAAKPEATTKPDAKSSTPKPPDKPAPAQQQPAERSKSVFWPFVAGGVIAAALGFAASEMNVFNTRVETTELRQTLDRQQEQIAALESVEPVTPDAPDLSAIEADLASIAEAVSTLEIRLTALENRPTSSGDAPAPTADYSEELAALTASVEAQKAEIDRLLQNAQSIEEATAEAARRAAIQSALTKITAALNAGGGYSNAVNELSDSGVGEVPEAIASPSNEGVATLLSLQSDFPDTARSALAAARSAGVDGDDGGVGSFLRRQLGARSVAPREGSDPDAVLSRAEAAVREGRLADALNELETLPPEAQAAMESWLSDARARADAEAAVEDLSQRLTAN